MSETPDEPPESELARMTLSSDALHEGEEGYYLDCPNCGSSVTMMQIVEEGRCSGYVDEEAAEGDGGTDPTEANCEAELFLELAYTI